MTVAIVLFGISKAEHKHWSHAHAKTEINYNKSIENYKEHIYEYFSEQDQDIDVYITTNEMHESEQLNILNIYQPKKYCFMKNHVDKIISRNMKMCEVMKLCLESEKHYDLVLITRFDLIFKKKFSESNIDLTKFNVTTTHDKNVHICDNFYLFPYDSLKPLYDIVNADHNKMCHHIKNEIENINGIEYINYIYDRDKNQQFYEIYRPFDFYDSEMKIRLRKKLNLDTF
jgi:hypothetical protein